MPSTTESAAALALESADRHRLSLSVTADLPCGSSLSGLLRHEGHVKGPRGWPCSFSGDQLAPDECSKALHGIKIVLNVCSGRATLYRVVGLAHDLPRQIDTSAAPWQRVGDRSLAFHTPHYFKFARAAVCIRPNFMHIKG